MVTIEDCIVVFATNRRVVRRVGAAQSVELRSVAEELQQYRGSANLLRPVWGLASVDFISLPWSTYSPGRRVASGVSLTWFYNDSLFQ